VARLQQAEHLGKHDYGRTRNHECVLGADLAEGLDQILSRMATEVVADAPCGPACDLGVYISRVNRGDWFACHRRNLLLVALSAINEDALSGCEENRQSSWIPYFEHRPYDECAGSDRKRLWRQVRALWMRYSTAGGMRFNVNACCNCAYL
jgi:hypothetical protein